MGWDSSWYGKSTSAPQPIACAPPRSEPSRRALAVHPPAPTTAVQTDAASRSPAAMASIPSSNEMASSPPKRHDDPESPLRPRLTAEQTNILEEYFAHTPRPTTMQKKSHAERLGLTQEKINNWFQNRRAKSKHQNKTRRELSILTPDDPLVQQYLERLNEGQAMKLPTSPLQYSELAEPAMTFPGEGVCAVPEDPTQLAGWPLLDTVHYTTDNFIGHHDGSYGHIHAAFNSRAASRPFHSHPSVPDGDFSSASSAYQESLPEYALAPSTSDHSLLDGGFVEHVSPMAIGGPSTGMPTAEALQGQFLLQNPIVLPASGRLYGGMTASEPEPGPAPAGNLSLRLQAVTNNLSQAEPPRSPSPLSQSRQFSIDSSRRGSNQSDITNQNLLPVQRASPHPGPDSDGFKTPDLPDMSLASRRKRQRPANLISMRAVSASTAAEVSPRAKTATLPATAVRRIKSNGHSMNAFPGRVQKNGSQTPVRSPLNMAFFENVAQEEGSTYPDGTAVGDGSITMQMASYPELQRYPSTSWATSSPSSLGAPPLSACYTLNSFEDSMWMASPPITPFYASHQGDAQAAALEYLAQLEYPAEVPQSAPAHISSFGLQSVSPTSAHPPHAGAGPSGYGADRSHSIGRDTPFFQPQPLAPASQLPHQMEAASIVRPSSSGHSGIDMGSQQLGLGQYTFLATPQRPPQKELEVVLAQFPSPPTKPLALPRGEFTFQHSGPEDFAAEG